MLVLNLLVGWSIVRTAKPKNPRSMSGSHDAVSPVSIAANSLGITANLVTFCLSVHIGLTKDKLLTGRIVQLRSLTAAPWYQDVCSCAAWSAIPWSDLSFSVSASFRSDKATSSSAEELPTTVACIASSPGETPVTNARLTFEVACLVHFWPYGERKVSVGICVLCV